MARRRVRLSRRMVVPHRNDRGQGRRDACLVDANDVLLEMSGYTRQQVASGQITWRKLTPAEHLAESERQIEQLAHTGRIGPYKKDLIRADG